MIKEILRNALGSGGKRLQPVLRRLDESVTVFLLHDVSDGGAPFTKENNLCVSTELFRTQMRFVEDNFNPISMQRLLRGDVPARAAMVTFDDGYPGVFKDALPILSGMRMPCTIFMNMAPVFGEIFWSARAIYLCQKVKGFQRFLAQYSRPSFKLGHLECTQELIDLYEREYGNEYVSELPSYTGPYVSLGDLKKADDDPLVTLGSHLYNHFNVKHLSNDVLKDQYDRNSKALSEFKRYLPVFAFPFGQPGTCFSPSQASFLLHNGATRLFTGWPRPNYDHSAKLMDRIALNSSHKSENRLWFQVVKYPVLEMFGGAKSTVAKELEERES